MNHTTHPLLSAHFGNLKEHAAIVSKGIDSEQASNIVFSNEQDFMDMREASARSSCCNADLVEDGPLVFCMHCGESWAKV